MTIRKSVIAETSATDTEVAVRYQALALLRPTVSRAESRLRAKEGRAAELRLDLE